MLCFVCLAGIKESDTGLAPPALWDLAADKQTLQSEQPLQVARYERTRTFQLLRVTLKEIDLLKIYYIFKEIMLLFSRDR